MDEPRDFETALTGFLAASQAIVNAHYAAHLQNLMPPALVAEPGRRYVRIACQDSRNGGRYAWAFVDQTNGDILLAAGWKAPAKHARGNIYAKNPVASIGPHGPAYLR